MYMYVRPGLVEFLEETSKHYELVLFSTGSSSYTKSVVTALMDTIQNGYSDFEDPDRVKPTKDHYFEHILCRDQCSSNEKGHEVKNLNFFTGPGSNRDLKDCIIVDNSIYCYQTNLTNGLLVPNFIFGDADDDWLDKLKGYLVGEFIESENPGEWKDVRTTINRDLKFEEIFNLSTLSQIRQMMNKHVKYQAKTAANLELKA